MLNNRSMPTATVVPELAYPDVRKAAQWLCRAFGFAPRLWIGDHRAQLCVGDGALVLTAATEPRPASVMVRVQDVDAHFARARDAGAEIIQAPNTYPYGERQYSCRDAAGHTWTFSQSVADIEPATWGGVLDRWMARGA